MKTITVDFSTVFLGTVAKQGEHNVTQILFILPSDFENADFVNIEFVRSNGSKDVIDYLEPIDGVVTVPLTQTMTEAANRLKLQAVGYTVNGDKITEIAKSPVVSCLISRSLDVLDGEHKPSIIERMLLFIKYWSDKLVEMWRDKHTHANKETLDEITAQTIGDIALNTQDRHTHDNKTVLDDFSNSNGILQFDGHAVPQFLINDVAPTTEGGNDYYLNWINPNVWYRFGSADSPVTSISIYQLQGVDNSVAEEYVVEFWTGATAPSPVIFPSDVEWPDGSEPTWEANKHYQVSIVGNMGLYAEADYGEGV